VHTCHTMLGEEMRKTILVVLVFVSANALAGVFKCTDAAGKTQYQSKPCPEAKEAFEMNIKTGTALDLNEQRKKETMALEQQEQVQQQQQALEQLLEQRKKDSLAQSEITQSLIKNNPIQYSAYAIPPYDPENLPALVKQFEKRLPEIEKFRRLAAQKALLTGQCQRVEADELNAKSQNNLLVFLVDCSSGKSFYYNETELSGQ
jgi:uncharacterized protein DUF4124